MNLEFQPMQVNKNILIQALREDPKTTLENCLPKWPGTAEEAIIALVNDPAEWLEDVRLKYTR